MSHLDPPQAGDPRYDGFRIEALWAWTTVDPQDDQEGIITIAGAGGAPLPLIASDRVRVDEFRLYAQVIAGQLGQPVSLRRFIPADPDPLEVVEP